MVHFRLQDHDIFEVWLGEHNLKKDTENLPPVHKNITRFVVHPNYNHSSDENDIVLLQMKEPIDFQPHIQPVCLPSDTDKHLFKKIGIAIGWGRLAYKGSYPSILQKVLREFYSALQVDHKRVSFFLSPNCFAYTG